MCRLCRPITHFAARYTGRPVPACGMWSTYCTSGPALVTCAECRDTWQWESASARQSPRESARA